MINKKHAVFYFCLLLSLLVLVLAIRDGNSLRIILAAGGFLVFLVLLIASVRKTK
ncbi:MAG: hypothetical protein ABIR30_02250 [Chitinophagaceae bacterium]